MPITVPADLRRPTQEEFGRTAYAVVGEAFRIHAELGRFFDEKIYQRELAARLPDARAEVPIEVAFADFTMVYYFDLLVADGSIFELKTVQTIHARHRAQLLHYLLLTEVPRGKLINFRSESVEHEFVNTTLRHCDRRKFRIADDGWTAHREVRGLIVDVLRDWGTGLDVNLYTDMLTHFLGGEEYVFSDVDIVVDGWPRGVQKMRLLEPRIAFKISALAQKQMPKFEEHLRRFLRHTALDALQWINITRDIVTFKTLEKGQED